jgi:hypothetical protein
VTRKVPRLPAYPRTDGIRGLRVWCCWCGRWHFHSPGYGHRAAHCHNAESPYADTGYMLTSPAAIEAKATA